MKQRLQTTGALFIAFDALHITFSSQSPPKKYIDPKLDESFFPLESHLTGEPCDYFLVSIIVAQNNVLTCIFCIVWCQQISIWNKQIESSIYSIKQVGKHARTQKILSECSKFDKVFFSLMRGGWIQIPL